MREGRETSDAETEHDVSTRWFEHCTSFESLLKMTHILVNPITQGNRLKWLSTTLVPLEVLTLSFTEVDLCAKVGFGRRSSVLLEGN